MRTAPRVAFEPVSKALVRVTRSARSHRTSLYLVPTATQSANIPQPVRFANMDQILVRAERTEEIPTAIRQITDLLHERHRIHSGQPDDFNGNPRPIPIGRGIPLQRPRHDPEQRPAIRPILWLTTLRQIDGLAPLAAFFLLRPCEPSRLASLAIWRGHYSGH
jgi:hypothetical protein